jgi:pimeloyl-ACP methyl ester carboxylesterase
MSTPSRYSGGAGTPVVLLHGATATWHAWRPVLGELGRHHRVLAPTLAGHRGGTPLTCPPGEVVSRIVDDVAQFLDEVGLADAHLVGNSLGGWVALELARRGRARSVVALSPAGAWKLPRDLERLLRLFRLGARVGSWQVVHRMAKIGWVRRIVLRAVCEHGDRIPAAAAAEMFEDMAGCSVLPALLSGAHLAGPIAPFIEVPCPVRIAWAERDRTIPFHRYGRSMLTAVPQAELVVMRGVGHVPMYDDPALVVNTILAVTTAVDGTSAGGRALTKEKR